MKANRKITLVLIILMIIIIILFIINEIFFEGNSYNIIQSILLNIFSGLLTSLIISLLTFNIEKEKLENNIINQLISYYSYLNVFYSITTIFLKGGKREYSNKFILLQKALKRLDERNKYYFNVDKDIIYIFDLKKEKQIFYNDIDIFSNGIELENEINVYISFYNNKAYSLNEVFKYCSEYTYSQMLKVDEIMEKLNTKFNKNINWNQIKKDKCIGFIVEKDSGD